MKLSIIILGKTCTLKETDSVEILYSNGENIIEDLNKTRGSYVTFINSSDEISQNYIEEILKKIDNKVDCIFINYKVNYNYKNPIKPLYNQNILSKNIPKNGEYIWAYVYKVEKLIQLLKTNINDFDKKAEELFTKTDAITEILYTHNQKEKSLIEPLPLKDTKDYIEYKNIIYVGSYCNGIFNGYVTWIENLGKCFSKDYDITILYDEIFDKTLEKFSKYFRCVKRKNDLNYICDRLFVTYSTFYYPKNIFHIEENYLFIHGNMSDYPNSMKYPDDIYTKYIAVSKTSANKAKGYFNTKKIYYIYNPFKLNTEVMPHLKLTSAQRASKEKKVERIELIAAILDEEKIPYTWNLFTDKNEGTNKGGLIYRERTTNPYPYIKDSDYFVILSDSEACPYVVLESLSLNTKLIATPLEVFKELGLNDDNSVTIPFEYFEKENKEKLRNLILKIYENKKKEFNYEYSPNKYHGYKSLFKQ